MTTPFFARAKKIITTRAINLRDLLNGNAGRRQRLRAKALYATVCCESHHIIKAREAARHKLQHP
ncbi:hypothetical protein PU634_04980 [Oceanimonas pelagia]|uniref:Uncharacterized protein n=1 Tax=Oceanimonas pelagia TaxID=3028314 RepID=A0AA50KR06_9GAMM|nr:hypothetical protein [Oceanimonas pelagia]WMC11721.1 hypothetical protein PU634_04980 [Oceanimonas pelagia]